MGAGFRVRVVAEEAADLAIAGAVPVSGADAAVGVEIVLRARRRRHVTACGRARPPGEGAAVRDQPRQGRLPGRSRDPGPRPGGTGPGRAATYTVDERLTIDVTRRARRRGRRRVVGAQRGDRGEVRPRADARAAGRGRRAGAVPVRVRRRGVRDPDRLDGVRVLRRWTGGLAGGRGAAAGTDQCARAVQPRAA